MYSLLKITERWTGLIFVLLVWCFFVLGLSHQMNL